MHFGARIPTHVACPEFAEGRPTLKTRDADLSKNPRDQNRASPPYLRPRCAFCVAPRNIFRTKPHWPTAGRENIFLPERL
jgi:hypothetical protein